MNKSYLIFKHEFRNVVKSVGFKIFTLLMPVLVILTLIITQVISGIVKTSADKIKTIGYVDEVGTFSNNATGKNVKLIKYGTMEEAKQSLTRNDIAEFFVVSQDYLSKGTINRYTLKKELYTPYDSSSFIKEFLTDNLLTGKVNEDTAQLIKAQLNLASIKLNKSGAIDPEQGGFGNLVIPGLFAFLLAFYLNISSSTMAQGLGIEKENRIIEVLLSSVSSRQLFTGKLFGLGAAGLFQVFIWLGSAQLLYLIASSFSGGFISSIKLPANFLLLGLVYFILGYLLFAVMSLGIGAISPNSRESVKYTMIYALLGPYVPLWFSSLLINLPDSTICVILTIFPFTAPVTTMLRIGVSGVPSWQIIASISVLIVSITGLFFLATKAFKINLLMYGKKNAIKEIFRNAFR